MAEVLVRGEAEVRCLPDRAILRVGVDGEGAGQDLAFEAASKAAAAVDAALDRYADAIDRRITAGVMVQPKTRWKKGESVKTGWRATRTTVVEVTDIVKVGAVLAELPRAGASEITGPTWQVDRANPAHDDVRRDAALDARRRAAAYAHALNLEIGALSWLSEPGLRSGGGSARQAIATSAPMLMGSPAGVEDYMDVSPEEITLHATVEASYELVDADN